jgi:phenylacetate-CoA ligase
MYTALVSNLLFPLQGRMKRHDGVAVRSRLEESQWRPAKRWRGPLVDRLHGQVTAARGKGERHA